MSAAMLDSLLFLVVSGVSRPLPPLLVPMLTALSRGAGGGAGFLLPRPDRFGGAGGMGFAFGTGLVATLAAPLIPFRLLLEVEVGS